MHRGGRRKPLCKGVLRLPPGPHPPSRNFSLWTFSRLQCLHTRQTKSTDAFPSIAPVRQNAFPRSGSTLRAHACSACTRHAHTAPAPLQGQKGGMQACRTRPLTRPALTKKILGRWMGGAGGRRTALLSKGWPSSPRMQRLALRKRISRSGRGVHGQSLRQCPAGGAQHPEEVRLRP